MELVFICITTFYRLCYQGGFSLTFDANVRRNTKKIVTCGHTPSNLTNIERNWSNNSFK